jgi:FkbM family methyltransferase
MTSPPGADLHAALGRIGRSKGVREQLVAACQAAEALPENATTAIREEVTGPIVDALHAQAGVVCKELENGLVLEFLYRSKIARDFVLSVPEKPDHVWEPQTTKLLLRLAGEAAHVVVGGAYFGDHAVLLAHALAGHGGLCHAFEPNSDQAAMLARNGERNGLTNLRINTVGLWNDDSSRLRLSGEDALAVTCPLVPEIEADDANGTFAATTLDTYLDREGVEEVELIVLDIEGAELAALEGARRRLALPPGRAPRLVFEVHRDYVDWTEGLQNTEVLRYLATLGYRIYAIRDFQSNRDLGDRPIELVPPDTAYLEGPPHGFNMLAIKDHAVVEDARFTISPGVSPKLLVHRDPALHHPTGGL